MTADELFDALRNVKDPEFDCSLGTLNVVSKTGVALFPAFKKAIVLFRPTVPHCHMASLIGLALIYELRQRLGHEYKVLVQIRPGTHYHCRAINKQLRDEERVFAAFESQNLLKTVRKLCNRN